MNIYDWFCKDSYRTNKMPEKLYAVLDGGTLTFREKEEMNPLKLKDGNVIGVYHLQNSKTAKVVLE